LRQYIKTLSHRRLRGPGGFIFLFVDGSLLEVTGKRFDSIKTMKGASGQMCVSAYVGKWLAACEFAREGEGEETVGRRLFTETVERVLKPSRLVKQTLLVADSLYGDGPTLDEVEKARHVRFIIGANDLDRARMQMEEAPEAMWRAARDGSGDQVMQMWLQCEDWPKKRLLVCRRWQCEGEFLWRHSAVLTNLDANDPRVTRLMADENLGFEEVVWRLYSHKQAMENHWKETLIDLGLHHPPCARAVVNAVFYNLAATAYNLSVFVREMAFGGKERGMRLWRFRQEVLHLAGRVVQHGRYVTAVLLDARDRPVMQLADGMSRLDGL
jgi:hypothetical protein